MNEKQIISQMKEKLALMCQLDDEIKKLRSQLIGICSHSDTSEYKWEWDSGYGVQHSMIGKRCNDCSFIDLWNRGRFVDRKDIEV